jgi:hypothetical protein
MEGKIFNTQEVQGFIIEESICDYGLEAIAVANGKIILNQISTNEAFAKADLGFSYAKESEYHAKKRHELYSKIFPQNYEMKWCGIKKWDDLISTILVKN